jgi:6-phosphogluconolactonase
MNGLARRVAWLGVCAVACGDDASPADDGTTTSATVGTTATSTTTASTSTTASTTTTDTTSTTTTGEDPDTSSGTTEAPLPDAVAIYVASGGSILRFDVDTDTGALVAALPLDTGATPGPMTHDAGRLFVGLTDDEAIATYAIATDGALTPIGTTPIDMNPVYLSLAESGPYVLVADFGGDDVASFGVDATGTIEPGAIVTLATGARPHSIVLAPDRRFAFVPHLQANTVVQLVFDATLGVLSPHAPTTGTPPANAGPRHMVFAPDASVAWVVNEIGDSVMTWTYDAAMGQLALAQTITTLPDGTDGSDSYCGDIHVTPDGRFVYASNRGHDTLAMFAVQPEGTLVAMGHAATEPHVRDFAIEPGGRWLYAAGRDSGQIASYAIEAGGTLTPLGTTEASPTPVWVEAVALPQ